jgi:hypothetical protein
MEWEKMYGYDRIHYGYEGPEGPSSGQDRQDASTWRVVCLRDSGGFGGFPAHGFQTSQDPGRGGLFNSRKDGLWVHYRLDNGSSSPYVAAILGNLKHWLEETPEITEITKKLPDIRRANLCRHNSRYVPVNLKNKGG